LLPSGKQLGGAPANFAFHAQALGAQGIMVSAVGKDSLGKEILTRLHDLGLETCHLAVDEAHPTGTVSVSLDRHGLPSYVIHENVAWDFIPFTAGLAELAGQADAVCFGSLAQRREGSRQTIRSFLEKTRPGTIKIFDVNLRQKFYNAEIILTSLELAEVLKINEDELPILAKMLKLNRTEEIDVMAALADRFRLKMIVLTKGGHGSILYAGGKAFAHPGHKTEKIVDTVGAGDAFTAAVALGLLKNWAPEQINDGANRLAAFVCSQPGGTPELPSRLKALLA
jgi:fructokinase